MSFDRERFIPFIIMGIVAALALIPVILYAQEAVYGQAPDIKDTTLISAIYDTPASYVGKTIKVEGLIVDVCSRRGCWMSIASDRAFETLRIKVADGEIVFPITARGQKAAVQGKVQEIRMTKEQAFEFARHQAQESGIKFDPSTVTGPTVLYQSYATGAVIQ
ncbi:MAG: DUF4920 domain-containing protein [bacterium]|nr:DUF4920 domain-containing protein [bacterium]MDT8366749.1 DUF4920 domain-containing protein [bacterium]